MNDKLWQHVDSTYVHENGFYKIRKDNVIRPDGKPGTYHVIETNGSVIIIVIDNQDRLLMEYMYRYPHESWGWETPAGGIEAGEEPLAAAQRELFEETGLRAKTWELVGTSEPANSVMTSVHYIFTCRGLDTSQSKLQVEEGITELTAMTMDEVMTLIAEGEIQDETTLGPLLVALAKGKLPAYSPDLLQK